jgi:hypothetical protein
VAIVHIRFSPYAKTARRRPDTEHLTRLTSGDRMIGLAVRWRGRWHGLIRTPA